MLGILTFFALSMITNSRAQNECYYDGNDFCINQNDILSVDLMPGSILLMDQMSRKNDNAENIDNITIDGTMDSALGEMGFHRKRMNEYLCHGFMAEEIFREMKTTRVKRRPNENDAHVNSLPDFFPEPNTQDYISENEIEYSNENDNLTVQHKLLADEGSAKYKNWLQRTTTLDDIYRHYGPHKKLKKKFGFRHPPRLSSVQGHTIEGFDGEVTGYAMPASISPDKTGPYYDIQEDHMMPSSSGHSYHQYSPADHYPPSHHHHSDVVPIIHEEHYYEQPSHHDEEEYWHRPSYHGKGKGHELTIKDFFEIALTALAFLAFGLFIIQLLMNITNANMTTAPPVVADPDGRFRRDAEYGNPMNYGNNEALNELSHRVLRSIEAALIAERDSGQCLRWSLCTDNRHSRAISGPPKIWLPVWSLGMSWVSGRLLNRRSWPTMLESIKASVFGLGGADCSSIYPNCNLARERIKRRRRRRK